MREKRARKIANNETSGLEKGRWILGHLNLSETGQSHITAGCLRQCFQLCLSSLLFCDVITEMPFRLNFFFFFLMWGCGGGVGEIQQGKSKRKREKKSPSSLIAGLPAVWQSQWRHYRHLELSLELIAVNLFFLGKVTKAWAVTVTRMSSGLSSCSGKAHSTPAPLVFSIVQRVPKDGDKRQADLPPRQVIQQMEKN